MLESLLALLLLLALVGLCYAAGRLALLRLTAPHSLLEQFVFAVPLGMGMVGFLVFALGLTGILSPIPFLILLGVGGPAGLFLLSRDCFQAKPAPPPRGPTAIACYLALALLGVFTLIPALAPPAGLEWDSLSYHLAAPEVYLQKGRIEYLPWDHHSNFPFLLQMLYLMMLALGSIGAAKLCHWLCGVLLALSVYALAARYLAPRLGANCAPAATLIFAATPIVLWEATTAYVDLATALFTWLSVAALLGGGTLLSALLMGFALGTKYTVLGFWGMVLLGLAGAEVLKARKVTGQAVGRVALWAIVALAIGAPWYLKNIASTGNPVYPFAYELFGGKYWSAENARQYATEQATFGLGKTPLDLLLSPWNVTMEAGLPKPARGFIFTEYVIFGLSPVFLALLLLAPFVGRELSPLSRACLLFGLGVSIFWFLMMQQTRYLIPALPAFALAAAEVLFLLRAGGWRIAGGVGGGLLAVTTLWSLHLTAALAFTGALGFPPAWPVVSGQVSREEYVSRTFPLGAASFWINRNTPEDAGVALFEVRGFYLERPYLWAQPDHAEGLLPWNEYTDVDDWLADFKRRGLTTLVMSRAVLAQDDGRRWRSLFAEAVAGGKLTPVHQVGDVLVYRIAQ